MHHREIKLGSLNNNLKLRGPIIDNGKGDYLIGCENGLLIYNPKNKDINKDKPQPYIREIYSNGKLFYQNQSLSNKNLTFKSGTTHILVKISALGFDLPKETTYKYKLENDWIDVGSSHEINITNLSQGKYNLKIKAINHQDIQNDNPINYKFTILGPWYNTFWAYALYLVLLLSLLHIIYKSNLKRKLALAENKKVKEIDELKSKMYANISHEFRTPLTIISGLSYELLEDENTVKKKRLLESITYSNNQLLNLVNQMLDLASLDAKKMTPSYKNGDVIKFIEKAVSLYKSYCDSKQVTLNFKTDISNLTMDFDDDKLQKIANNLLSNAIKFTPEGGEINVHLKQTKDKLIIKVSDKGKGIGLKNLSKIFERYYKTYDFNQNVGTGIGLALTKELVEVLQGDISVQSKQGKGTIFTVALPINNTAVKGEAIIKTPFIDDTGFKEETIKQSSQEKTINTILLVEDNKEIRNFIKLILGDLYTIYTAKNGIEGLEIAEKKHIDFIISDVMMPKMDGFEFCQQIKSNLKTSHIPFVIISARTETKDKVEGYSLGIDAYLTKPFNKEELLLIIKNLLNKKQERIEYFSKLLHLQEEHKEEPNFSEIDLNLIKNMQEYALDNTKQMSIDKLAYSLYTSRTQLHRKVKALTGMSITHYLNHIRIEKAKYLLKTTQLTMSEIAYEIGFESTTYFSRIFKKETTTTPASYREKHS